MDPDEAGGGADHNIKDNTPAAPPGDIVPPDASLVRTWVTLARRPSRRAFAAWAQVTSRDWIVTSLAVAAVFALVNNSVSVLKLLFLPARVSSTAHYYLGVPSTTERILYDLAIAPVVAIVGVLATAYAVALVMPAAGRGIGARFEQVLRPLALAQVISAAAGLVAGIATAGLDVLSRSSGLSCASSFILFGLLAYSVVLEVNSLSAGSGKGRWTVFGLTLLTYSILFAALLLISAALTYLFGLHLVPF